MISFGKPSVTDPKNLSFLGGIKVEITFEHADAVAKKLHPLNGQSRIQGAILSSVNSWRGGMGSYYTDDEVTDSIQRMTNISIKRIPLSIA